MLNREGAGVAAEAAGTVACGSAAGAHVVGVVGGLFI